MALKKISEQYYLFLKEYFLQQKEHPLFDVSALVLELVRAKISSREMARLRETALQRLSKEFPEENLRQINQAFSKILMKLLISFGRHLDSLIKERQSAEEALLKSEKHRSSILQTAADAVITINSEGNILVWNNAAEKIFGYSSAEMLGNNLSRIIPGRFTTGHLEGIARLREGGKSKLIGKISEYSARRKDGKEFPVELSLSRWEAENEIYFTGIIRDITERKQAQEAIKKSEALFRTTLYSIGDAVITTDRKGRVQQLNPTAEKLTGWKEPEAAGEPLEQVFTIINEESGKKMEDPVKKVLRRGIVVGLANHTLLVSRNGKEIPIADSGAPIKNDQGEITGVVLVFRDQTKEREAQRAVAAAREYAESIVATIREPLVVLDANLRVLSANRSFYQTFQTDEKATVGKYIYDLGNRQWNIPKLRELLEQILPQNTSFNDFEVEVRFASGERRTMLLNARRIYHDSHKTRMILLAMEDITERKKAETELKIRNEELETFNDIAVNRELKIIELKKEVNNLLKTCKKKPKYKILA